MGLGIYALKMKEGGAGEMRWKAVRDDRSSDVLRYTLFFYPQDLPHLIHHRLGCSGTAPAHLQNYLLGLKLRGTWDISLLGDLSRMGMRQYFLNREEIVR